MKKIIIAIVTILALTSNASAANESTGTSITTVKTVTSPVNYRWVATMANGVKYTVTMFISNDSQSYMTIKTEKPGEQVTVEELAVAAGAENVQMDLSNDRRKMSVYYYANGPVTIDIEDLIN